ncbi:MAG: RagB/SusD family nutrient uptake outer membrane protein [Balneolaceae bacterium]|nr:RagB/SusD family nutrient uptake outer membrane protein [Balneolaceae bacterium]
MKKKIVCLVALISIGLIGCEDFLNKTDPTATTFVEYFNDEGDLQRVVYSSFLDVFTHQSDRRLLLYMKDGRSDNAYARLEGDHHQIIANGNMNATSSLAEYYYTLHLKHVGRLNTFIANINAPYVDNEDVRTRYENILKGLRLWHYFEVTFRWGDVSFHMEPADLVDAVQPITPKEEILEIIFPMAEQVAESLPPDEYTTNRFMFNRYSFKALTMRYALYHGRYEMASRLAQEIIDSGRYELHPTYGDLFQYTAHSNNNEFIIIQNDESFSGSNTFSFRDLGPHYRTGSGESYAVPLKSLVDAYWTLQGNPINECPIYDAEDYELNPRLNRDPRYEASIFGHGDQFIDDIIDVYDSNSPFYYDQQRASSSGYWFRKFVSDDDAFRNGTMHFGLLRYAEVLLTYAEAKIMMNDIDDLAKQYINMVRERAGLDMSVADVTLPQYDSYSQQDWLELIQNERRIEFAGEGLRYDDIIRWRIAEDVLNQPALGHTRLVDGQLESLHIEDRSFQSHQYKWPFHESSLRVEPTLNQNPGY